MVNSYYCLSRVTDRKLRIIQGIDASNRAIQVIRVIGLATLNAQNQPALRLDDLMQHEHIPLTYRFTIIGSHVSSAGKITIPGLFRLLEIISDQIQIITHSVDSDLHESMPGLHEKISCLSSLHITLKNLDFIFDEERMGDFLGADYSDPNSLLGQISSCKSCLETMREWFTPCLEYGAL